MRHPPRRRAGSRPLVDFDRVNRAALSAMPAILARWLPGGRYEGREYTVRNPKRADTKPGSFRINTQTGKWSDFAVPCGGRDPVSLAAYLAGISQVEAARQLAGMLGISADA